MPEALPSTIIPTNATIIKSTVTIPHNFPHFFLLFVSSPLVRSNTNKDLQGSSFVWDASLSFRFNIRFSAYGQTIQQIEATFNFWIFALGSESFSSSESLSSDGIGSGVKIPILSRLSEM